MRLLLSLVCAATASIAIAAPIESVPRGPHKLALCAGLLTTPTFDGLGHRLNLGEITETGVESRVKELRFARKFESDGAMVGYLSSALAAAKILDQSKVVAKETAAPFWKLERLATLAATGLPTTMMIGLPFYSVVGSLCEGMPLWGVAAQTAFYAGCYYLTKDYWKTIGEVLPYFTQKAGREVLESLDEKWATAQALDLAPSANERWPEYKTVTVRWDASEAVVQLLLTPPRTDAVEVEIENYRTMLETAVAESIRTEAHDRTIRIRMVLVHVPGKSNPELTVVVKISSPNPTAGGRRRGPRALEQTSPDVNGGFLPAPAR